MGLRKAVFWKVVDWFLGGWVDSARDLLDGEGRRAAARARAHVVGMDAVAAVRKLGARPVVPYDPRPGIDEARRALEEAKSLEVEVFEVLPGSQAKAYRDAVRHALKALSQMESWLKGLSGPGGLIDPAWPWCGAVFNMVNLSAHDHATKVEAAISVLARTRGARMAS